MKMLTRKLVTWGTGIVAAALVVGNILPRLVFPDLPVLPVEAYKALFPFQSHFAELDDGSRVHYVDEGKGPTLLLLHGNPTSAYLYREMINKLKSDYRVIAPDYPGFGQSSAPAGYGYTAQEQADTIISFFDFMNIDDVIIMVQDWGGPIGLNLVQHRPEQFSGLVIGNTWAWPLQGQTRFEIFSWLMGGPIGKWLNNAHNGVVHLFLRRGMAQSLTQEEYTGYFHRFNKGDRRPVTIFPRELITSTPFLASVEKSMDKLSAYKTLIVWGEQDFAFQETERMRFEGYFPNHHTQMLENAGHFIQDDSPTEIVAAIRATFPPTENSPGSVPD
jgi:haloalkane dehalogenase